MNKRKKELSMCRDNKKIKSFDREEVIDNLGDYHADKWLKLDFFSTIKLKDILCLLLIEQTELKSMVYDQEWSIYGANFYPLNSLAVRALSQCKSMSDAGKQASFIDVGSGWGHVTWKALLAGCKVHSLDIGFSREVFQKGFNDTIKTIVPKDVYQNNLVIVNTSIYDVLPEHPEFFEQFDIIYSSKVLHFQTPKNFNKFARIIYDLAKASAKVYITADSSLSLLLNSESCKKIYKHNKESHDIAPGYVYHEPEDRSICKDGSREDMQSWDSFPVVNINGDDMPIAMGTFDLDSLRLIFEPAGFRTEKAYYLSYSEKKFPAFFEEVENIEFGNAGAAIELEKSTSSVISGEDGLTYYF